MSDKLTRAFDIARTLHAEQVRKGTSIPYLSHPLAVCALVLEHGGDEDEACAALLHDVVEDGGGLEALKGVESRVVDIVLECSDSALPKGAAKRPWRDRKIEHLERMRDASDSAKLVMTADKLHNAQSILADLAEHGAGVWSRFKGGREGTVWYYRSACDVLGQGSQGTKREKLAQHLQAAAMSLDIA